MQSLIGLIADIAVLIAEADIVFCHLTNVCGTTLAVCQLLGIVGRGAYRQNQ